MKIGKTTALLILVVTVMPIILLPLSIVLMSTNDLDSSLDSPSQNFDVLFNVGIAVNTLIFILALGYIAYMYITPNVPREKRALWIVILLFVNVFAMPFFWYWYVWSPSTISGDLESAKKKKKTILIPILIGVAIISIFPILLIFHAYKQGHSYEYLADLYPPINMNDFSEIYSGTISISRRYDKGMSAIYLSDGFKIYTGDSGVRFTPTFIKSFMYRPLEIPIANIHSCSRQCGGSKRYLLILDEANTEISLEDAPELVEWCWVNKLPILSSNARREWLYNGTELPDKSELNLTLVDKETYDYHAKQSCLGY